MVEDLSQEMAHSCDNFNPPSDAEKDPYAMLR